MQSPANPSVWSESKADIFHSFQLLRQNFSPFLYTQLFAIIASILVSIPVAIIWNSAASDPGAFHPIRLLFVFYGFFNLLINAFNNAQFGLAYDVLSSGLMYAEFRDAFTYFRSFWWQYSILTMLTLFFHNSTIFRPFLPSFVVRYFGESVNIAAAIGILTPFTIFELACVVLFVMTFPSVTARKSFKGCFIENFRILRQNGKRVFSTIALYFLIFQFPQLFAMWLVLVFQPPLQATLFPEIFVVALIFYSFFISFIGAPVRALAATRIYNTAKFAPYQLKNTPVEVKA